VILGFAQLLTFVSIETGIAALQDALAGVPAVAAFVGGLWPTGRSVTTITLSHITLSMAFVTVVVRSRLGTLDPALEEAAQDLGATPLRVLTSITLPLLAPALAAGWLLAFTLSLDDLVLASFTSGPSSTTLPMVVYSSVRLGVSPQVNALASILIAVVALGIVLATVLLSRGRQRSRERQPAREGLLVQGGQRG
jgi:putrescine transport system permease protein